MMRVLYIWCCVAWLSGIALAQLPPNGEEPPKAERKLKKTTGWLTDFEQAKKEAETFRQPVFVYFVHHGCPDCKLLNREILSTATFMDFAKRNLILLEVDAMIDKGSKDKLTTQNKELRRLYGNSCTPDIRLLNAQGRVLGRIVDYDEKVTGKTYVANIKKMFAEEDVYILNEKQSVVAEKSPTPYEKMTAGKTKPDGTPAKAKTKGWLTDFGQAQKEAAAFGQPILAVFTRSDDGGPGAVLKQEALDAREFGKFAAESLILFEADFANAKTPANAERNKELADRYGVNAYPMVLLLDAQGKPIGRVDGYRTGGGKTYVAHVKKALGATGTGNHANRAGR